MKKKESTAIVLENDAGRVLRFFQWDSPQIHLVKKTKTNRLEALSNIGKNEDYYFVSSHEVKNLSKTPTSIVSDYIFIRKVADAETLPVYLSESLNYDSDDEYKKTLKWSTYVHAALLFIGVSLFWTHKFFFEETQPVVTIELPKQNTPKKIVTTPAVRKIVKPSHKKIDQKVKVSDVKVQKKLAKTPVAKSTKKIIRPTKNVKNMGALAALGGFSNGSQGGKGLNLNSTLNGAGSGSSSGTSSIGKANAALAGKGLMSGGGGHKSGANLGHVGYGTKGKSGGRAGYGKLNIGGSSENFELPMQGGGAVAGGLEMSQIEAVIRQNIGQIFYCYEKGLQSQPQLNGRVVTKFIINASGKVQIAKVGQSSLNSSSVEKCMVTKIKGWKFPKPYGEVDVNVSYPFVLKRAKHG